MDYDTTSDLAIPDVDSLNIPIGAKMFGSVRGTPDDDDLATSSDAAPVTYAPDQSRKEVIDKIIENWMNLVTR